MTRADLNNLEDNKAYYCEFQTTDLAQVLLEDMKLFAYETHPILIRPVSIYNDQGEIVGENIPHPEISYKKLHHDSEWVDNGPVFSAHMEFYKSVKEFQALGAENYNIHDGNIPPGAHKRFMELKDIIASFFMEPADKEMLESIQDEAQKEIEIQKIKNRVGKLIFTNKGEDKKSRLKKFEKLRKFNMEYHFKYRRAKSRLLENDEKTLFLFAGPSIVYVPIKKNRLGLFKQTHIDTLNSVYTWLPPEALNIKRFRHERLSP